MNKLKFENRAAKIFAETRLKAVTVEWITVPTSAEYREALTKGLEVLKENKFTRWIGDVRHLGGVSEEDQRWSTRIWFPEAMKTGINKLGVIVSDDIFNQLSVEEIVSRIDSDDLSSHYFSSPEEALSWIR